MEELKEAVSRVKLRIRNHRDLYSKNEEAVKQHLIGEIFRALGWDWSNPEEVRPEERTEDGRADYALILDGEVVAYVEAKNLSVNVLKREEPLRQLARYCFNSGVRYGVLTNGSAWVAVKAFEEGSRLRDRVLFTVNLEEESAERAALKLSFLSKDRISRLEELSSLLKAFELSFSGLVREGYRAELLVEYLMSKGRPKLIHISELTGKEEPKVAYVYDGGWKMIPLSERSMKGLLLAVLLYIARKSHGRKKAEVQKAYDQIRKVSIGPQTALEVLKNLEKEEGIRIAVEL